MKAKYKVVKSDNGRRYRIFYVEKEPAGKDIYTVYLTGLTRGVKDATIIMNKQELEACLIR